MVMKNPPHPSKHIRLTCLQPTGLTVTAPAAFDAVVISDVIRGCRNPPLVIIWYTWGIITKIIILA